MNPIRQLVVIGAGAAGLMAAITARRQKNEVLLLERKNMVGLKILATGDGRANVTNLDLGVTHYHSHYPEFVLPALKVFGFRETWHFFEELGVKLCITDRGRVFPYSREALVIQKMLMSEIVHLEVGICLGVKIQEIRKIGHTFEIKMKQTPSIYAKNVILATGGLAASQLGATGDGYQWAAKLGHHVETLFPSLVQLTTYFTGSYLLNKVKIADVIISLLIEEKVIEGKRGDILFIPQGISGSAIFDLSRMASEALSQQKKVAIQINFISDFTIEDLITFFKERKRDRPEQLMVILLGGILPDKMSRFILKLLDIDPNLSVGLLPGNQIDRLVQEITHFYIPITGTRSWKYAQVTGGGVSVNEVNSETMESTIVPHLYFAGEILDVDGDCGGYNLQWAWSSGYIAGKSAVENS